MLYSLEPTHINSLDDEELERMFCTMCSYGKLKDVKYLLTCPDITNKPDINKSIGFRWAAAEGRVDIVQYLLFSPEIKENFNLDKNLEALKSCCANLDTLKYITTSQDFKKLPNVDNKEILLYLVENTPLKAKNNFFSSAKYLITNKLVPKDTIESVFLSICGKKNIKWLEFLLKKDIVKHFDIRANNDAALKAIVKNDDDMGKLFLIHYGVDNIFQRKDIMKQLSSNLSRTINSLALSQKLERCLDKSEAVIKKVKI